MTPLSPVHRALIVKSLRDGATKSREAYLVAWQTAMRGLCTVYGLREIGANALMQDIAQPHYEEFVKLMVASRSTLNAHAERAE